METFFRGAGVAEPLSRIGMQEIGKMLTGHRKDGINNLKGLGLPVEDLSKLLALLGYRSEDSVKQNEFIQRCIKVRNDGRSIDMRAVLQETNEAVQRLQSQVNAICKPIPIEPRDT